MGTTANDSVHVAAEEVRSLKEAAREAARRARAAGNQEVEKLIAEVEELVARLADPNDPGIARLRAKVTDAVRSTKRVIADRAVQAQRQAREALAAGDTYVHQQPWEAIGAAALIGLVLGFVLFRR
jgi:ElaB/YqjD/DUF883 family membrane-anchored ribosome-binding protein